MIVKLLFIILIFEATASPADNFTSLGNNEEELIPNSTENPESNQNDIANILRNEEQKAEKTRSANITFLEEFSKDISKYNMTEKEYSFLIDTLPYLRFNVTEYTFDKFMTIMSNIFPLQVNMWEIYLPFNFYIQMSVEYLLSITRHYQNIHEDWIIKVWRPFEDDITGIALYKNYAENSITVREIHRNQNEENINTADLEVAAYVPHEFLENLIKNGLNKDKNLTIVMTILNGQKFQGLWGLEDDMDYIVGMSVPGYCKHDIIPLIRVFFKGDTKSKVSHWIEFGNNYLDVPRYVTGLCFTSKLLFFGKSNKINDKYFESIKYDYCNDNYQGVTTTSRRDFRYSAKFCVNKHGLLEEGYYCITNETLTCHNSGPISNKTELFYEMLLQCSSSFNLTYCFECFLYIAERASSEADVIIGIEMFTHLKLQSQPLDSNKHNKVKNGLMTLLGNELTYLANEKGQSQIIKLTSLFYVIGRAQLITDDYSVIYPHLIYQRLKKDSPIVGSVFYKNEDSSQSFNVKPLHASNATSNYSSDATVDVTFSITNSCPQNTDCKPFTDDCHLFVINNNITVYPNETSTSKILAVFCNSYQDRQFSVYFRGKNEEGSTGEYDINERYFLSDVVHVRMLLMYLSHPKDNATSNYLNLFKEDFDENGYMFRLDNRIAKNN